MIVDYILAKECKNEEVWYTCYQCGKCGRAFENGYMVDDGGTTVEEQNNDIRCRTALRQMERMQD